MGLVTEGFCEVSYVPVWNFMEIKNVNEMAASSRFSGLFLSYKLSARCK
jgi:hypothetical protein